jgi:hypothetical protein
MQTQIQARDEFLCRYGDLIDDRVADVLDEMFTERDELSPGWRLRPGLAALSLLLATATSVVLRHSVLAVCTVWLSVAAVCVITAWTTRPGRP